MFKKIIHILDLLKEYRNIIFKNKIHQQKSILNPNKKTVLTKEDVIKGFELYKINECDSEDEKLTSAEHAVCLILR